MSNQSIEQVADILLHAKKSKIPCLPIRDVLPNGTIKEAYQVQAIGVENEISQGNKITGKKIGLTSKSVQKQLGVDEPDFGTLFNSMQIDNGTLDYDLLMQPKAEAEWAFVLKNTIDDPVNSIDELSSCIDYAVVAIEIVGSRIKDWDITILDTVADNASASHYILGKQKIQLNEINLTDCKMQLYQNEELASTGEGSACMGNPLNAVKWLANKMIEMQTPLQKGEVVLSGALGPMVNLKSKDTLKVIIDNFEALELIIS
jgi:2-keto-4-pentenoate hydratase